MYSCNGRPFIQQLKEQSGTWFRDVRLPANLARPLQQFHTPDELLDQLRRNREAAQQQLQQEAFAYLKLRDYQVNTSDSLRSDSTIITEVCEGLAGFYGTEVEF